MASRKLVRDFLLTKKTLYSNLLTTSRQVSNSGERDLILAKNTLFSNHLTTSRQVKNSGERVRLINEKRVWVNNYNIRQFSVLKEFSQKLKGEANSNEQFQKSVKELKEKAEELKEVTEDLKVRSKETSEKLYKQFDGVWTEAEATAKKVSENLKEKISAATEEVKESFGSGKQEPPKSSDESFEDRGGAKREKETNSEEQPGASDDANTYFNKFKSSFSSVSPKVSVVFQKLKEAKPVDLAKKGYDIVKDELSATPKRRKRLEYVPPPPTSQSTGERSTRKDITIVPIKQSRFSKKFEALKAKIQGHPLFKRVSGMSEPVVVKSQEFAEDMRDRWETSDSPVVHKIQDLSDTVLGETSSALSFKEIRARDPSFSLPEFVAEIQEVVRPVIVAYSKGDVVVLKKYCSKEVIERCDAERKAFQSQGFYFDNKLLHVSDVEVKETKMMGETPIIIVGFQTQQVYCIRDKLGAITEGGKDTIHTVIYGWAMQQLDVDEIGEGAFFPIWKIREIVQYNVKALI